MLLFRAVIIPVACLFVCLIGSIIYFWNHVIKRAGRTNNQIAVSGSSITNTPIQIIDAPPLYIDLFHTGTNNIIKSCPNNLLYKIENENSQPPSYSSLTNIGN
jgi:hypothetical protein